MTDFLHRHTLHLTPLSPLHLGTGEDYEPTNYIIADNALYAFDPAQAELDPAQRNKLLGVAKSGDIQRIQQYFADNPDPFRAAAHSISSVSSALASEYHKSLGKVAQREQRGNLVFNRLNIERTATNPHNHTPLIPGSALKGCLRTALMEMRSEKQPPATFRLNTPLKEKREQLRYEEDLLGSFATDLLRLVKPADLNASGDIATHICYATNHKKKNIIGKDGRPVAGKGVTGRRETIQHGQYRAFSGALTLHNLLLDHQPRLKNPEKNLPGEPRPDLARLIRAANHYHLTRYKKENELLLERGLVAPAWQRSTEQLLRQLVPQFDAGTILLVRLGKNGGAETHLRKTHQNRLARRRKHQRPTQPPPLRLGADRNRPNRRQRRPARLVPTKQRPPQRHRRPARQTARRANRQSRTGGKKRRQSRSPGRRRRRRTCSGAGRSRTPCRPARTRTPRA